MATFRDLQDRINGDYLNRFNVISETKRAIRNAIKTFEAQRFWFNQASTASAATVGTVVYGLPSDLITFDKLEISYSGSRYSLKQFTFDEEREMNASSATGVPTHFAYYGDQFRLAVQPDSAYSITTYYLRSLPELSADADSNAWTNEAANLIVHTACVDLLCGVLQVPDNKLIERHTTMAHIALNELHLRNDIRLFRRLQATQF